MTQETPIAVSNIEQLLSAAYQPEMADPAFVQNVEEHLLFAAHQLAQERTKKNAVDVRPCTPVAHAPGSPSTDPARLARIRRQCAWAMTMAASLAICAIGWYASDRFSPQAQPPQSSADAKAQVFPVHEMGFGLTPRPRPAAVQAQALAVGETLTTHAAERRRVTLADGSILYVNQNTVVEQTASRRLNVQRGEIYLEVQPAEADKFLVTTPSGQLTALGTRFAVNVDGDETGVLVTQGKVRVTVKTGKKP